MHFFKGLANYKTYDPNNCKEVLKIEMEDRPTMKEVATKLEGLRTMEKHSQVNADFNSEKTEHLLARTSNSSKYDVRNDSTDIYMIASKTM